MRSEQVNGWSREEFCCEFFATLDEMYRDWRKANNDATLPDWEEALVRAKREGVLPLGEKT